MSDKKKITIGVILTLVGIALFIMDFLFASNREELLIPRMIAYGVSGVCVGKGIRLIRHGCNPKKERQEEIEEQYERNQLIRGKAAYIALWAINIPIVVFAIFVTYMLKNEIAGLLCYGIAVVGWAAYGIAKKVISSKI